MLNLNYPTFTYESIADAPAGAAHFSAVNCPRLHQRDRREVPTWKDWVAILAGNENILDTYSSGRATRCMALSEYADYTTLYRPWGKTFGKHRGPRGLPLCEVKPLDEMFWYFDSPNTPRHLKYYTGSYQVNDAAMLGFYYNSSAGWSYNLTTDGITPSSQGWHTLEPGVYGCTNSAYNAGNVYWMVIDETGPTLPGEPQVLTRSYSNTTIWKYMNAIFFVDSPILIRPEWSNSAYMMGSLFRITPPGYWVP